MVLHPHFYKDFEISGQENLRYSLRSTESMTLVISKAKFKTHGDRSFAAVAVKLWNDLRYEFRLENLRTINTLN